MGEQEPVFVVIEKVRECYVCIGDSLEAIARAYPNTDVHKIKLPWQEVFDRIISCTYGNSSRSSAVMKGLENYFIERNAPSGMAIEAATLYRWEKTSDEKRNINDPFKEGELEHMAKART